MIDRYLLLNNIKGVLIMRIHQNIPSMQAMNAFNTHQANATKNLQKLASGFKINKAGDDAAGLAISEKMRGQIAGLNMATKNATDGISLIQTAEGALNETHSMLQRIRELSVQAANDTNTDEDRQKLQLEVDNLLEGIQSIANNTQFNTKKLSNGSTLNAMNPVTLQIGANSVQTMKLALNGEATLKGLGFIHEINIPGEVIHQDYQVHVLNYNVSSKALNKFLQLNNDEVVIRNDYNALGNNLREATYEKDLNGNAKLIDGNLMDIPKELFEKLKKYNESSTNPDLLKEEHDLINQELAKLNTSYTAYHLEKNKKMLMLLREHTPYEKL